jgi:hypothetical protein
LDTPAPPAPASLPPAPPLVLPALVSALIPTAFDTPAPTPPKLPEPPFPPLIVPLLVSVVIGSEFDKPVPPAPCPCAGSDLAGPSAAGDWSSPRPSERDSLAPRDSEGEGCVAATIGPASCFSYVDLEARVRRDHPLRAIRVVVNEAMAVLERDQLGELRLRVFVAIPDRRQS